MFNCTQTCRLGVIISWLFFCVHVADCFVITTSSRTAGRNCMPSKQRHISTPRGHRQHHHHRHSPSSSSPSLTSSSTALNVLLDVPEGFFTVTFFTAGILLSLSKNFARVRMEERAWEQRLEEGRKERLARDPSLTEMDLRRMEAELEWSAYGKPRLQEELEKDKLREREEAGYNYESRGRRRRVKTMERGSDDDDTIYDVDTDPSRQYKMTDEEIQAFEVQYGVDYDPYYDDPYTEDELPNESKYTVDKRYGDRIYDNGEIFYKDASTGLFYRQGAKPRNLNFW